MSPYSIEEFLEDLEAIEAADVHLDQAMAAQQALLAARLLDGTTGCEGCITVLRHTASVVLTAGNHVSAPSTGGM